jgi:hypothetical protein
MKVLVTKTGKTREGDDLKEGIKLGVNHDKFQMLSAFQLAESKKL